MDGDTFLEVQPDTSDNQNRIPDGGYGWVIVFASFFILGLGMGLAFSFGVIYVELQDYYNVDAGLSAWVGAISVGLALGAGPLASTLSHAFGHRPCCVLGSMITSVGFFVSAFAPNVYFLFGSYGGMIGIGISLTYVPAVSVVGFYFKKRLAVASGLILSGAGFGSLIFPSLILAIIRAYSIRGAMFILSGLALNMAVFGALLRPQPFSRNSNTKLFDISLLKDINMILYVSAEILWNIASLIIMTVTPHHSFLLGVEKEKSALLLTAVGVAGTLGRLMFVLVPVRWNALTMLIGATFMTGVPMLLYIMWDFFWLHVVLCVVYGLCFGVQVAVMPVVLVNLFGVEKLTSSFGLLMLADGIGAFIGPNIGGVLFDRRGDYRYAFIVGALVSFLSGCLMTAIFMIEHCKQKTIKDVDLQDL